MSNLNINLGNPEIQKYEDFKKETLKTSAKEKPQSPKRNTGSRRNRIDKIMRDLNNKYIMDLKATDIENLKENEVYQEVQKLQKENKVNNKNKLRDEVILDMEKKNQEIEDKLKELKNKDKSELEMEERKCKETWEEINKFFHLKKEEALKKDEIRKADLEEINKIKINQTKVQQEIQDLEKRKKLLEEECESLEHQVKESEYYKTFIEEVIEKNDEFHGDFEKLKDKFENLMKTMRSIKDSIAQQEAQILETQEKQKNLKSKNDKYLQNQKLVQLEEEIKKYINENKMLERDIDELVREQQKKESDNHQIIHSIINLHEKVLSSQKKKFKTTMEVDEEKLCLKLDEINSRIVDLIQILEKMEKIQQQNNNKTAKDKEKK